MIITYIFFFLTKGGFLSRGARKIDVCFYIFVRNVQICGKNNLQKKEEGTIFLNQLDEKHNYRKQTFLDTYTIFFSLTLLLTFFTPTRLSVSPQTL